MTGILGKFQVEHGVDGARIAARSHFLTERCASDEEIETAVQMLKDDLDACAREMKRVMALHRRGSVFEGWPSVRDDVLDA